MPFLYYIIRPCSISMDGNKIDLDGNGNGNHIKLERKRAKMEQEKRDEICEAIVLIIAFTVMLVGIIKYNENKIENGNEIVTENAEVFYVPCVVTRGADYVSFEYYGNEYSAWIDTESKIQTGDYIWAGLRYEGNELQFVNMRLGYPLHN